MDFSEDRLFTESQGRRCAAERHDIELDARENKVHARRDPRADGAQCFGRDVVVVEDAGLVKRDAGLANKDAKFVLHRLVGGQDD